MVKIIRDIRYILKRVIIGILIGLGIFILKDKVVFAETLSDYNIEQCATYHFKPCIFETIDDEDYITCGLYLNDWFDIDIEVEFGSSCPNGVASKETNLYPSEDISFILSHIDYKMTSRDNYGFNLHNYYNNNSFTSSSNMNFKALTQDNGSKIYGYIYNDDYSAYNYFKNGYGSILGSRVFSCSLVDRNNNEIDCLNNMNYYSNYNNSPIYIEQPIINRQGLNNTTYLSFEYSYGYNGNGFREEINTFIDHFTTPPFKQGVSIEPYPLAFYDFETSAGGQVPIYLPTGGNSLFYNFSYEDNTSFTSLGNIPIPIEPEPVIPDEPLTPEQQEIIDDVNEIFDQFTPELWENISNNSGNLTEVTGQLSTLLATPYATGFSGLLDELFTGWIEVFDDYISPNAPDLWERNTIGLTNYNYCYGSYIDGSSLGPHKLRLWEYRDGNSYRYFEFNLPCLTDYYSKIVSPSGLYGFPQFYAIYRTIVDGLLAYWVIIQLLQFYKYVLEPKNSKIEVLDI